MNLQAKSQLLIANWQKYSSAMPATKNVANKHMSQLRKRVAKAPIDPGIYRWLDKKGNTLYIGKAKNLRNRLKSYLQEPDKSIGPWKTMMLKQIADFDVTVTNTELEALVLETNLIKESKPKYNVLMKDDKSYVYVQFSIKDPYTAIEVVRRGIAEGTRGFGPFTSAGDIRKTLDMLHIIFPYKACKKSLEALNKAVQKGEDPQNIFSKNSAPCLEHQIGQCCGLCVGAMTQKEYRESVESVIRFLKGDHKEASGKLKEKMQQKVLLLLKRLVGL